MVKEGYKETRVGYLPVEWEEKDLEDLLSKNESGTWGQKPDGDGLTFPVLRSTNMDLDTMSLTYEDVAQRKLTKKTANKYELEEGDILINKSSGSKKHIGKLAMFNNPPDNQKYLFSNFTQRIRIKEDKYNNDFIYYFLTSYKAQSYLERIHGTSSGLRNLDIDAYNIQPVPVPPLSEQKKIASILSSVDKSIEKTDDVIEETKELKKGLMQELLTKGIGHSEFKEVKFGSISEIIPKKWGLSSLEKVISVLSGNYFKLNEFVDSGVRCLKIDNVDFGKVSWDNKTYLPEKYLNEYSKYVLNVGDIVLALNRPIIRNKVKVGKLEKKDLPSILYQRVGKIILDDDSLDSEYLFYYFSNPLFRDQLNNRLVGTDQPYISNKELYTIKIQIPPLEEQRKIASILSSVDEKIKKEEEYKVKLERLKKGLMQKLLTGEIRVNTEMEV